VKKRRKEAFPGYGRLGKGKGGRGKKRKEKKDLTFFANMYSLRDGKRKKGKERKKKRRGGRSSSSDLLA